MPKALFVCYGGGHVAMVIPVVKELQRRGDWDVTILGLTTAGPRLRAAGIPFWGFRDLLTSDDHEALRHGQRLLEGNSNPAAGIDREESLAYLGLSYRDLEIRLGVELAAEEYREKGRHAFLPLTSVERAIRRVAPDVVVATCSPKSERAAIQVAQSRGIPAVAMIDLFGREWDFLYDPNYADRIFVPSTQVREDYLRRGFAPEKVAATGNPAFDRLADPVLFQQGKRWRSEQRLDAKRVVLWADTLMLTDEHRQRVFSALADGVRRHPDWHLVYRPHPSMVGGAWNLPAGCSLADTKLDLAIHLHAADCVLVTISTCGLEGALLDKAVVKMRFGDPRGTIFHPDYVRMDRLAPFEEMGIAATAESLGELEPVIRAAMEEGELSESLRRARRQLPPVGTAAERVCDELSRLTSTTMHKHGQAAA